MCANVNAFVLLRRFCFHHSTVIIGKNAQRSGVLILILSIYLALSVIYVQLSYLRYSTLKLCLKVIRLFGFRLHLSDQRNGRTIYPYLYSSLSLSVLLTTLVTDLLDEYLLVELTPLSMLCLGE